MGKLPEFGMEKEHFLKTRMLGRGEESGHYGTSSVNNQIVCIFDFLATSLLQLLDHMIVVQNRS